MINNILKKWIAQSESWQTFIDFKLPSDSIARYDFLNRPDDFYISLFGNVYNILEEPDLNSDEILSIAKGLEIYSLKNKKEKFIGVNQADNILISSGLYYLANYSASASILANLFNFDDFATDIEKFLLSFLRRKNIENNQYRILLDNYLYTGENKHLEELLAKVVEGKNHFYSFSPHLFFIYYLTESILIKFKQSNIWIDLLKFNNKEHWNDYVQQSIKKKFPVWDFFPSQKLAFEKGVLNEYISIALQTPTSSGKTAICELLIYNEIKNNPDLKILYLAPFRALASELKKTFGRNLAKLNISSKTIYGGDIPTAEERNIIQGVDLLISTPEKFVAIENIEPGFSEKFNLIICDEGHLLDDKGNRGLSYELLLSRLKKDGNKKFVFLSAIIPNIDNINTWLGGSDESIVKSNYRATEIEYAFLKVSDNTKKKYELLVNPLSDFPKKYTLYKFITEEDLSYKVQLKTKEKIEYDKSEKSKSAIITLKALESGSVALFAPTKGGKSGVESLSEEIIRQIEIKPHIFNKPYVENDIVKQNLKEYFNIIFGNNYLLTTAVEYGFLFHHGDLPQYVREIIEEHISSGKIKLIVSTRTLAEGVNLPIKTIVIHSTRWYNPETEEQESIKLRDLKNLFGRAGRAGRETKGLVIVPNTKDHENVKKVIKEEQIEKVEGFLYQIIKSLTKRKLEISMEILENLRQKDKLLIDTIDKSIIDLLGEDVDVDQLETEIENLIKETFASYQSGEEEQKTLKSLISLRGEKLKPYIENGEFVIIKKSSSTIRMYEELVNLINIDDEIWTNADNPLNEHWINLIFSILSHSSIIQYKLEEFNKINIKNEEKFLSLSDIKNCVKFWIQGNWFNEISQQCLGNIGLALKIINSFVGFELQNIISSIIHIAESKLKDNEKEISRTILNFPKFLCYGLNSQLQLDLMEIGFTDRIGILELSKILEGNIDYSEAYELKIIFHNNDEQIIKNIKDNVPEISLKKIVETFNYFDFEIIF